MSLEQIETKGDLEIIIECNGHCEVINIQNTVLRLGRCALARVLGNNLNEYFDFYVNHMLFGDGGTVGGVKRYVDASRQGLFGVTRIRKPVIATIDSNVPTQVIFTSVISYEEGLGMTINEMALQMANGELYSMVTFPDLTITENMAITFNWRQSFV
jgi:hypothetical protein